MPSRLVPILFAGMAPGIQGSDNYEPGENRKLERNGERGLFSGEVGKEDCAFLPPLPFLPSLPSIQKPVKALRPPDLAVC